MQLLGKRTVFSSVYVLYDCKKSSISAKKVMCYTLRMKNGNNNAGNRSSITSGGGNISDSQITPPAANAKPLSKSVIYLKHGNRKDIVCLYPNVDEYFECFEHYHTKLNYKCNISDIILYRYYGVSLQKLNEIWEV
jgi:hypothetical protein